VKPHKASSLPALVKPEKLTLVLRDPRGSTEIFFPRPEAMALYDFKSTCKPQTWATYEVALRDFFDFLARLQPPVLSPQDVTTTHITSYIAYLESEGKKPRTIINYIAACSSFFDFMTRPKDTKGQSLIQSNPFRTVKERLPTIQPYQKSGDLREMNKDEFKKILDTCDRKTLLGKRDYAILWLILYTTRRRKEIMNLRIADFSRDGGKPYIRFIMKGGDEQKVELTSIVWEAILDYWKASGRKMTRESPVFVATTDAGKYLVQARGLHRRDGEGPLAPSALDQMVKSRGRQAGIDETEVHLHVHGIRHLAARTLHQMGMDVKKIKEKLGHKNLNTTDIYLGSMKRISTEGMEALERLILGDGQEAPRDDDPLADLLGEGPPTSSAPAGQPARPPKRR